MITKQEFLANISRWLYLSVGQHFKTTAQDTKFKMYIQGQKKSKKTEAAQKDFFELRTDGPYVRWLSKTRFDLEYQINTLIQSTIDDVSFDRPYIDMGKILPAFVSIPIFKYGTGPQDNPSALIGCLRVGKQGRVDEIRVNQFGIIDIANHIIQASIEAHMVLEADLGKIT